MIITFWGVRGTIPTPGSGTVRYGGNTACVSVTCEDRVLVLDAGTGICPLGQAITGDGRELFVLLSHLHTDHLCGFPFFEPLYEAERVIHLLDYPHEAGPWTLLDLLDGLHFPLRPEHLRSTCHRVAEDPAGYLRRYGFDVEALPVNHPGGAFGYRLTHRGRRFVFIPDNELDAASPVTSFDRFVAFCRGADVLCHDAQYFEHELPARHGWGHSCVRRVCDLAVAAGVGHLILFHHDPERTDHVLDVLQETARAYLRGHDVRCTVAYEGLQINLDAGDP